MVTFNPHRNASAALRERARLDAPQDAGAADAERRAEQAQRLLGGNFELADDRGCDPYNNAGRFIRVHR